jgi:hypothetical protein
MIIVPKPSSDKYKFKDTLGSLPSKMSSKSYMQIYHAHKDYEPVYDESMGFTLRVRITFNAKKFFQNIEKFVSKAAKDIEKILKPVTRVVQDVGEFSEDAYNAVKTAVITTLPAPLRSLVTDQILYLEKLVTNPVATITEIPQDATQLANNIVRESVNAVDYTYKNVAKPVFTISRNVANEVAWKPFQKVIDVTVMPLLPADVREKLDKYLDIPEKAFSGKLTDKVVVEGIKSFIQIGMLPAKLYADLNNGIYNVLMKDAVLGPFISKLDQYSGGLISAANNLQATPGQIYDDKNIDWKGKIIDGLKIYLATVGAGTIANFGKTMAINAVGAETGLDQTPLGRTALSVGVAYGSAYAGGELSNLAKGQLSTVSKDIALQATKSAAISEAKSETVKEAVKKGWVEDSFTAKMILSAGGKFYDAAGTDKTLMETMKEVHDAEFQKYIEHEVKKRTGLPITYGNLVDVYNTDWSKLSDDLKNAFKTSPGGEPGKEEKSFLSRMGQSFVDEMKRVPQNFSNISQDVLKEIERTPENMAKFASNVFNEANRTPENIANIASNIANESVRATENAMRAAEQAKKDAERLAKEAADKAAELARRAAEETQRIAKEAAENAAREAQRAAENLANQAKRTNWDELVKKYGNGIIAYLNMRYPNYTPDMPLDESMIGDIELNYLPPKKKFTTGQSVVAVGIVGAALAAYVAMND